MTKPEKIEEISRACIAANPSILDLKFGTWVKLWGAKLRQITRVVSSEKGDIMVERYNITVFHKGEYDVLGRTILAQDILPLLPHYWMLKGVGDRHEFICMTDFGNKKFKNDYFLWDKGTLEDQSEAHINRIYELIQK